MQVIRVSEKGSTSDLRETTFEAASYGIAVHDAATGCDRVDECVDGAAAIEAGAQDRTWRWLTRPPPGHRT